MSKREIFAAFGKKSVRHIISYECHIHTQNGFSLSKIVGKCIKKWKFPRNSSLICDLFSKYLIRKVIVSPFPIIFNAPIPFPKADKMIYVAVAHRPGFSL